MVYTGISTDKRTLLRRLEELTGSFADYSGAPKFEYRFGEYTVLREGDLEAPDEETEVIHMLVEEGLIAAEQSEEEGFFPVSVDHPDGRTLRNIAFALASKQALINKAMGWGERIRIPKKVVDALTNAAPDSYGDFMEVLAENGGASALKGVRFQKDAVLFRESDDEVMQTAWEELAEAIVRNAGQRAWIKPECGDVTNEKYAFRVWMNSLGMKGESFKSTRDAFLTNLDGDATFRTPEQKEEFIGRRRTTRRLEREARQPEFIAL